MDATTYSISGYIPRLYSTSAGCDSLVTLNLTITNATGTDTQTACDSLVWIDGITYRGNNNNATSHCARQLQVVTV